LPLPEPILSVLDAFRPEFRRPTWPRALTLLAGTLLARGRRTVAAALRAAGHGDDPGFRRYHEVLSRAAWSPLRLARRLLGLLVAAFAPAGGLTLVVDETLERRWGRKITKRSHHRDPVASSRGQPVVASGLRWVVAAVVVAVPWARRPWALPFLGQLAPSAKVDARQGRRHKTLAHRARQVAAAARRWLPGVPLTLVGDTSYSVIALGRACARRRVRLVAPLWWKACLHEPPPPRTPGRRGRPPKVGPALPKLRAVLADPATAWTAAEVAWPDGTARRLDLVSGVALWNQSGEPALPVRWVLTRDPAGALESRAYFSTQPDDDPAWVVGEFAKRWAIEVTFAESRAHLGVETQRQWSDRAIEREPPCLLGLYSVVALLTRAVAAGSGVPVRVAAWYRKSGATFADGLAAVRRHLWAVEDFCEPEADPRFARILRSDLDRLANAACYAH
jgi:DDE superfamily endonuclease